MFISVSGCALMDGLLFFLRCDSSEPNTEAQCIHMHLICTVDLGDESQ